MSSSPFTLRRMVPADKPAMLSIASRIWEGNDYLPAVFDAWVADRQGEFTAVLLGGRVVGCAKLTFLSPTDAWLEGLRKDPQVSERGLGLAAVEHFLSILAGRRDLTSLRFATYVKNRASIITNERAGFRVRTTLSVKAWEGTRVELLGRVSRERAGGPAGRPARQPAVVRDGRAILDFLRRHPYFEQTQGLVVEGWKAWPWSEDRFLERFASAGACRGIFGPRGLEALSAWTVARRPGRESARLICLEAEDDEAAAALLGDVFGGLAESSGSSAESSGGLAESSGSSAESSGGLAESSGGPAESFGGPDGGTKCEVEWMVPPGERFRRWAAAAGLASWEQENDFLVYEMPLEELARRAAAASA